MSAAVMPMRKTVSAPAICGNAKAAATVSIMRAVVVRLFTGLSLRIAVISFSTLLINCYAILCNGCANGEKHSFNLRGRHNWSRVGAKNEHNA
jgi:hypothetical protein